MDMSNASIKKREMRWTGATDVNDNVVFNADRHACKECRALAPQPTQHVPWRLSHM
jgi:hypothetical protein